MPPSNWAPSNVTAPSENDALPKPTLLWLNSAWSKLTRAPVKVAPVKMTRLPEKAASVNVTTPPRRSASAKLAVPPDLLPSAQQNPIGCRAMSRKHLGRAHREWLDAVTQLRRAD